MSKPGKLERSSSNDLPQSQAKDEMNYKNNNKKRSNKGLCCPFACSNCQSLGRDLVKSKYEIVNILSDTGDSIFSPMHEQYHDDDEDNKSAVVRNSGGKVFLSVDLMVDSFFQNFKK